MYVYKMLFLLFSKDFGPFAIVAPEIVRARDSNHGIDKRMTKSGSCQRKEGGVHTGYPACDREVLSVNLTGPRKPSSLLQSKATKSFIFPVVIDIVKQ